MKIVLFLLCFISISSALNAQQDVSLDSLSNLEKKDSIRPHSVRTALLLSAGLPGAGQVYNHIAMPKGKKKAYWKVPLIYAGLGATTYLLITNQRNVSSLRAEYTYMENNFGAHSDGSEWIGYDQSGVLELHSQYQTWRDLSIVAVGLVYLLQVADAGVEAHFVNFDVSHDLSLRLDPTILNGRTPGLALSLKFR
jgi:hypothetical protein